MGNRYFPNRTHTHAHTVFYLDQMLNQLCQNRHRVSNNNNNNAVNNGSLSVFLSTERVRLTKEAQIDKDDIW